MATNYIAPTWRMPENANKNKFSNYSINFNGSEYIDFGNFNDFDTTDAFSGSCWLYTYPEANTDIILSKEANSGTYKGYALYLTNTNKLRFILSASYPNDYFDVFITSSLTTNTWNHLAFTYDGSTNVTGVKLYVNGFLQTTSSSGSATISGSISNSLPFQISGRGGSAANGVSGKIDQVCIFNYELAENQVTYLYNLNNPMAITGAKPIAYYPLGDNSNPIRLQGYPNLAAGGSVFDFVSSSVNSQAIDLGTNTFSFTQNLTISFWIKTSQTVTNSLTTKDNNQITGGRCWAIYFNQSLPGKIQFWTTSTGSTSNIKVISSDTTLNDNKWHHVVCVNNYTNSTKQIYIDGVLDKTNNDGAAIFNSAAMVQIGNRATNPRFPYDGQMSNLAFWDTAFTLPQVEEAYNNGVPGDISSLNPVAWYKLNAADTFNGSNWTIKDYGSGSNDGTSVDMNSANLVQSNLDSITPYSNYSIKFNGSDQYFGDGTTSGVFNGATSLSISQWINIDPGETEFIGAANWQGPGKYQYLTRYRSQSGGFDFYVRVSGASRYGRFTTSITGGAWYHVVGTWDGSNVRIYLNGVPGTPMSTTGTLDASTGENLIGLYQNTRADGLMSNVAYWYNKTLTQQEVSEIYNNGITTDLNNFSGGAPTRWYPMDGKSTYFNGSTLTARDVINNVDMLGYNTVQTSIEGNAPGSSANGTGNNLDISNLKGNMSNSINNSYSINMADYGDPNNQGLTPANSGRTTDVPG